MRKDAIHPKLVKEFRFIKYKRNSLIASQICKSCSRIHVYTYFWIFHDCTNYPSFPPSMTNVTISVISRRATLRELCRDGNKSSLSRRHEKWPRYESTRQSVRDCLSITARPTVVFTIYRKFVTRRGDPPGKGRAVKENWKLRAVQ